MIKSCKWGLHFALGQRLYQQPETPSHPRYSGFEVTNMKRFLRLVSATAAVSVIVLAPAAFAAEENSSQLAPVFADSPALLSDTSQGYLGIGIRDIDNDRAAALKLKEPTGAEIITVDHDAPAGTAGLKQHDVILQMNGQPIAGAAQLRRMLHETPAGRSISLVISRDGQQQTVTATLADHATLEQNAWTKIKVFSDPGSDQDAYVLTPQNSKSGRNSFFGPLIFGGASIGVQLDTLGSQLADFFGVKDGQGLLVKHVADNSPASSAGLKAGDVVTKVNGQTMATLNDWTKTIHANRGKQVQVTIVRNRQQQVLTMQAGEGKHKGDLEIPDSIFDNDALPQLNAYLDGAPVIESDQSQQAWANIDTQKLQQDMKQLNTLDMKKLQDEMRDQSGKWQKQMDELKQSFQSLQWHEMD
jgi:membrane-associated protease RseP (regulator of RpoE activity)